MVVVDSGNRITKKGETVMETRVVLKELSRIAYAEERELIAMRGTVARFLGRADIDLKDAETVREVRKALLERLESWADGDYSHVASVKRRLSPDSSGRFDELSVGGGTIPAMVNDALSRHLRGVPVEQVRRCSDCGRVIITARRPKKEAAGTYCNHRCMDHANWARKKYA